MTLTWQAVAARPRGSVPFIMAHRGASDELPENTLAAFQRAIEQGANVLETDLRFTRDNEIVLIHDATLERTTDGSGPVSEMKLSDIKKLRSRGEAIPTLQELLEFVPAGTPLALELKDDRFLNLSDAAQLVEMLGRSGALERTAVVSFNLARVQSCKRIAPGLPGGAITLSNPFPLFPTEFLGPYFPLLYLNPLYVEWAKRMGKIVCPLDPAPEPRLRFYLRLGVPVLMTNHAAQTKRALERVTNPLG